VSPVASPLHSVPRPLPEPSLRRLPDTFGVVPSDRARVRDDGRTLVGGTAGKVLFLAPEAADVVAAMPSLVGAGALVGRVARLLLDRGFADPWWPAPAVPDAEVVDVTVVVPVQDRPGALDLLLGSLPPVVPVVVVDDGSADPAAVAEVAARHDARLVVHRRNLGPAAARNTGLRRVATPFVAFCDSDVVPESGWLGTLRRHLDDPALAVVAPRILGPEPRDDDAWLERYEQARSSLDLGTRPAAVRVHGAVSYLPSACLLARVDALGDGFDERMRVGEDVDLVWRLLTSGWGVRYEPAAAVRHTHRTQVGEWLRRKAFYGTSAADLAARHEGAVSPMVVAPWTATISVALLAQRRWSVPVALGVAAVATLTTASRLERSDRPLRAAAVLTLEGAVATARQTGAALTRHYWPLAALACLGSSRARRAVLVAAVADGLADHRRTAPRLDPARYVVARRLDDLAYGAGVWWGAARAGSPRALLPRLQGFPSLRRSPVSSHPVQGVGPSASVEATALPREH
jgi:mycofactocin system glycosyltransferase